MEPHCACYQPKTVHEAMLMYPKHELALTELLNVLEKKHSLSLKR